MILGAEKTAVVEPAAPASAQEFRAASAAEDQSRTDDLLAETVILGAGKGVEQAATPCDGSPEIPEQKDTRKPVAEADQLAETVILPSREVSSKGSGKPDE